MSKETTIGEIRADFGRQQTQVIHEYGDRVDEIAARDSDSVANREYLRYGQVEQILIDAKQSEVEAEAVEAHTPLPEAYERYEERVAKRTAAVKSELFGVTDVEAL